MKNHCIDYTWRVQGKEIVKCPNCRKQGVLRSFLDDVYIVVHRELPLIGEEEETHLEESCIVSAAEVKKVLYRKEVIRKEAYERKSRRRAKRRELVEDRKILSDQY